MAFGLHWEWRGFGALTTAFAKKYFQLPVLYAAEDIEDRYMWIPRLAVNAKFRSGRINGFKFKRLENKNGDFEQWREDPREMFDFPLGPEAWETLRQDLHQANLRLPEFPGRFLNREQTLLYLQNAGCRIVTVNKNRESRVWQGVYGDVKVEWACISAPQTIISIGLETAVEDAFDNVTEKPSDAFAVTDLVAAVNALALDKEPLKVMNYMQAVEEWVAAEAL